jgi:hydroxymethylglutaryl-CoA reductase (NADPH)
MSDLQTPIPTKWVGPIRVSGNAVEGEHEVPLATYESPLWPSVGRGARISRMIEGGIVSTVVDERMTRSVVVRATSAAAAHISAGRILARQSELETIVVGQSTRRSSGTCCSCASRSPRGTPPATTW